MQFWIIIMAVDSVVEMINIGLLENYNSAYIFAIVQKPVHIIQCMYEMTLEAVKHNFYSISLKLWSQKQID